MKKNIKRLIATVTVGLALVGAGGLTAFAAGQITWGGTENFQKAINNLESISNRGRELKTSNDKLTADNNKLTTDNNKLTTDNGNINSELEQAQNKLLEKDNKIITLEQEIKDLKASIEGGKTTRGQLEQAEIDMENVFEKSEEVLSSFDTAE